jgi:hypothetical protein
MSNVSRITWDGDSVVLSASGTLHAHSLDCALAGFSVAECEPRRVVLDMADVRRVKPGGVGITLSLLACLAERTIDRRGPLEIVGLSSQIESFLATLGVFSLLKRKAGLVNADDLIRLEEHRRGRRRERTRARPMGLSAANAQPTSVVMPFEEIPMSANGLYGVGQSDFDSCCRRFVNTAADNFEFLFQGAFLGRQFDPHEFWQSNVELYKNVYDHSESWGLGVVFATTKPPDAGTVVSYHDIGIGIPSSVNAAPQHAASALSDDKALMWAVEERNSSKPGNNGLGLHIVSECVRKLGGRIEIRSGSSRLVRNGREGEWIVQHVPALPGSHVSFFIPAQFEVDAT